jgi:hypothetical protein
VQNASIRPFAHLGIIHASKQDLQRQLAFSRLFHSKHPSAHKDPHYHVGRRDHCHGNTRLQLSGTEQAIALVGSADCITMVHKTYGRIIVQLTICLCRIRLGSHAVIMLVRPSTGTPRVAMMRSMCGMNRAWGRQKELAGDTSGHAGCQPISLQAVSSLPMTLC